MTPAVTQHREAALKILQEIAFRELTAYQGALASQSDKPSLRGPVRSMKKVPHVLALRGPAGIANGVLQCGGGLINSTVYKIQPPILTKMI